MTENEVNQTKEYTTFVVLFLLFVVLSSLFFKAIENVVQTKRKWK